VRIFGSSRYRSSGSLLSDQPSRWDSCTRRTVSPEVILEFAAERRAQSGSSAVSASIGRVQRHPPPGVRHRQRA
jgi:hypothetical protein